MPWQERSVMSLRWEFVVMVEQSGVSFEQLCRRFGISRPTGYKWWQRYQAFGRAGLVEQSRRPRTSPGRTTVAMEGEMLAVRDRHPSWGGRKIRARLRQQEAPGVPSASTVTEILRRHGRLDPAQAAQHSPWQRFEQAAPNDMWQLDFKEHIPLGQGRCHPFSVLDDHSRYAVGLFACASERDAAV